MSDHVFGTPYVTDTGTRVIDCSCGARFSGPTLDELRWLVREHMQQDPAHEHVWAFNVDEQSAESPEFDTCACGAVRLHEPGTRVETGAGALSIVVVLLAFATVGIALRFTGWGRLALALAAIALLGVGLRIDARPPIRRP